VSNLHARQDVDLHSDSKYGSVVRDVPCPYLSPTLAQTPVMSARSFDHHYYTLSFGDFSQIKSGASTSESTESNSMNPNSLNLHPEFNCLHGHAASPNNEDSTNSKDIAERYYNLKINCSCNNASPQFPGEIKQNCFCTHKLNVHFPQQLIEKQTSPTKQNFFRFEDADEWNQFNLEAKQWLNRFMTTEQSENSKQESKNKELLLPTQIDIESFKSVNKIDFLPLSDNSQDPQVVNVDV